MNLSARLWLEVEHRAARLDRAGLNRQPASPGRHLLALAFSLAAVCFVAVLPFFDPAGSVGPRLVVFPPWVSERSAIRMIVENGGEPVTVQHHLPLGMVGFVTSFPSGSTSSLQGISLRGILSIGCLSLPSRGRSDE